MNRNSLFSAAIVLLIAGFLPMCSESSGSDGILAPESLATKSNDTQAASTLPGSVPASAKITAEEIVIKISPGTIALNSSGEWVTVHAEIAYSAVDTESFSLNGIAAARTKPDDCGDLVVKVDLEEIKAIVSPPEALLTLSGAKLDGTPVTGSDTVRVTTREQT